MERKRSPQNLADEVPIKPLHCRWSIPQVSSSLRAFLRSCPGKSQNYSQRRTLSASTRLHRPPVAGYRQACRPCALQKLPHSTYLWHEEGCEDIFSRQTAKKWRNMYRITSFGCRSPWTRTGLGKSGISLTPAGMFPDRAISFPVKMQKIPCSDAQGISEYRIEIAERLGAFAWARNPQRAKFPVFSQLAGIFRSSWRVSRGHRFRTRPPTRGHPGMTLLSTSQWSTRPAF